MVLLEQSASNGSTADIFARPDISLEPTARERRRKSVQFLIAPCETAQFSDGLSTLSITRIFTGALAASSFRPSWSCRACTGGGPSGSGDVVGASDGAEAVGSGAQASVKSNLPLRPVRS